MSTALWISFRARFRGSNFHARKLTRELKRGQDDTRISAILVERRGDFHTRKFSMPNQTRKKYSKSPSQDPFDETNCHSISSIFVISVRFLKSKIGYLATGSQNFSTKFLLFHGVRSRRCLNAINFFFNAQKDPWRFSRCPRQPR